MKRMVGTVLGMALCAFGLVSGVLRAEDLSMCLRGWDATQAHDTARAITLYKGCIQEGRLSQPTLARTWRNIGITYRQAGQPVLAIAAFDRAIALHPDDIADDFIDRGNAHDEAGNFEQALADYAKALELDPGNGEAYYNRGIAYERHHQMQTAKDQFIAAYQHGLRSDRLYERLAIYGLLKDPP